MVFFMNYYNQHNFPHVPYPSSDLPNATVKSGGCGVCCAATILSFFGFNESKHQPPELSKTFRNRGARVAGGTDMHKAAQIACELGNLEYVTTSSETELTAHLKAGGAAIANVGGNRSGYTGVFSTSGHYICVLGLSGDKYKIFDVGDYNGKYSSTYRKSKVTTSGVLLLCTPDVLHKETENRTPNYYLFKRKEVKPMPETKPNVPEAPKGPHWAEKHLENLVDAGIIQTPEAWTDFETPVTKGQFLAALDKLFRGISK